MILIFKQWSHVNNIALLVTCQRFGMWPSILSRTLLHKRSFCFDLVQIWFSLGTELVEAWSSSGKKTFCRGEYFYRTRVRVRVKGFLFSKLCRTVFNGGVLFCPYWWNWCWFRVQNFVALFLFLCITCSSHKYPPNGCCLRNIIARQQTQTNSAAAEFHKHLIRFSGDGLHLAYDHMSANSWILTTKLQAKFILDHHWKL